MSQDLVVPGATINRIGAEASVDLIITLITYEEVLSTLVFYFIDSGSAVTGLTPWVGQLEGAS